MKTLCCLFKLWFNKVTTSEKPVCMPVQEEHCVLRSHWLQRVVFSLLDIRDASMSLSLHAFEQFTCSTNFASADQTPICL